MRHDFGSEPHNSHHLPEKSHTDPDQKPTDAHVDTLIVGSKRPRAFLEIPANQN